MHLWIPIVFGVILLPSVILLCLGRPLLTREAKGRISIPPNRLSIVQLLNVYAQLVQRSLPIPGSVPSPRVTAEGWQLPELEVTAPLVIEQSDLDNYRRAVKADADEPTTFILPAACSPMLVLILSHPLCPIAPLGAVNTSIELEMLKPELASDDQLINSSDLSVRATMGGLAKRRKRGIEFPIVVEVSNGSSVIFRFTFSTLKFLPKTAEPQFKGEKESEKAGPKLDESDLTVDIDRPHVMEWANLAKDYQPIHVGNRPIAKLFGLPGVIAHGQLVSYTFAHATYEARDGKGQAQGLVGAAAGAWWTGKWRAAFEFKRPMPYPLSLQASFGRESKDAPVHFALSRKGKEHITGTVQRLS